MLQEASRGADQGGKRSSSSQAQGGLSEEQLEELEEQYGLNKNVLVAYGQWLGVLPREVRISKGVYGDQGDEKIGGKLDKYAARNPLLDDSRSSSMSSPSVTNLSTSASIAAAFG